ncbi:GNAT family N-acetyltransferase [Propylenella binzhouense]|uniref:GNAT family N-acetyltransferase n=1 Tax=Propylenella binzhouense TaxID=2555902 RepID=A0A964T521_9HYPH|nr:GNAT family N-acetyltransferase [Propylenella binzhouense]MYZ47999.1 GNAT family N-acetyltransferase [Propylenella binzhouense]
MTALVIDVRKGRPADAEGIADVHAAAWREAYSGLIPAVALERMIVRRSAPWWREAVAKKRGLLVLDVGGKVAGYTTFGAARTRTSATVAEVQEFYLAPEYQGIGLGARLFAGAVKMLRAQGYVRLVIRALAENDRAVTFYERRGGRLVARSEETLGGKALPCLWFEFRL